MGLFGARAIMAVGKNKRLAKGKKGGKKKIVDPFSKKDWYDVKAPSMFAKRQIGKTLVSRTVGTKIASDGLKGRVFECNQADLHGDETTYRKMRLIVEDVQHRLHPEASQPAQEGLLRPTRSGVQHPREDG